MNKIWRVAKYEYRRHVLRKRFLLAILGLPLMVGLIFLVGALVAFTQIDRRPAGYVDLSGLLADPVLPPAGIASEPDRLVPYQRESEAQAALDAGEITAYYLLPSEFPETNQAELVYLDDQPDGSTRRQFEALVRANLFRDQSPVLVDQITRGINLVTRGPDGSRQPDWIEAVVQIALPMGIGLAFIIAIVTSADYLMKAVIEEKENRTMEVLVTSISSGKLIAGKILGITSVGLTQILVWFSVPLMILLVGSQTVPWFQQIRLGPTVLLILVAIMLPAYIMIAALMTALGATVTQASEGQQMTGLFIMPLFIPFWFLAPILSNPNSPLAIGLSFFPLTAPLALTLRLSITSIPTWQLMLNVAVLILAAIGAIWLAGRAFRLGMLRYGQRLKWRDLFRRAEVTS